MKILVIYFGLIAAFLFFISVIGNNSNGGWDD